MKRLLPPVVATAETDKHWDVPLFSDEALEVVRAVPKRRDEFTTGRACARCALQQLGLTPQPIAAGTHGEPLWPAGIVGSITHCRAYRACAVARATDFESIGIDAEPHERLPLGVLSTIATEPERAWVRRQSGETQVDRLLFSAKEAVYKAWFPVTRVALSFVDVEILFGADDRTFTARPTPSAPVPGDLILSRMRGTWLVTGGLLGTAVTLAHDRARLSSAA